MWTKQLASPRLRMMMRDVEIVPNPLLKLMRRRRGIQNE
jgi:hypothetical protein